MGYRLAPGVSYCRMDGGYVFLDRRSDRYLFLGGIVAAAFGRLAENGEPGAADARAYLGLVESGILQPAGEDRLAACASTVPRESLLDHLPEKVARARRLAAVARVERSRLMLWLLGLDATLARLERRKTSLSEASLSPLDLAPLVAPFASPGWVRKADGECLRRSLGLLDALLAAGVPATLVMAVKLRPFAAHSWVQTGAFLLNERHDRVRDFTPVLIL